LTRACLSASESSGGATTPRQLVNSRSIAADITAIPDLVFDARIIVASGVLGFSPNGERICFAEHVFYHFRDGRIAAVSSVIDRPAIEAQLRPDDK
jgi:predicted ester cyclase